MISRPAADPEFSRLRKTLYRKQDHASVSACGRFDASPLPKKGEAEMPFLLFGPFYQVEPSRSNCIEARYNLEDTSRFFSGLYIPRLSSLKFFISRVETEKRDYV